MGEEESIVRQIIAEIFEMDERDVTPDRSIFELGGDELDMVEIVMTLEEEMDIEFPDGTLLINPESNKQFSVGDVINSVSDLS